jgi:O-antigen/teichoic acid export membrane protein
VTTSRLLARNTALNLIGQIAPLVVAVLAVPPLVQALGSDRFGVLALAWALIGYFGLFDFGISRALTQAASEALGRGDHRHLHEVSSAAIFAAILLGCVGAVFIVVLTPWLAYDVLQMDPALRPEAAKAFYLLSVSLPFVLGTVAFRGLFEAHQHFGMATALRVPYSMFNFLGPLIIIPFTHDLAPIVIMLVIGRVLTCVAHAWFGLKRYPWLRKAPVANPAVVFPLLKLGGWMTVSTLASTVMVYLDRFLIGAILSMAAVAFYVTPFEVVTKLLFVPGAVLGVFFPAFAATYMQDRPRTATMYDRAARLMLFAMTPAIVGIAAFAHEGLQTWLNAEYARQGTLVLQWLAAGVLINSIGQVSSSLLQAVGRADVTARVHLVELPLYAVMIFVLTTRFGLPGVAMAWTGRMIIDSTVLGILTRRELPEASPAVSRTLTWTLSALVLLALVCAPANLSARIVAVVVGLAVFLGLAWRNLLLESERSLVLSLLRTPVIRAQRAG